MVIVCVPIYAPFPKSSIVIGICKPCILTIGIGMGVRDEMVFESIVAYHVLLHIEVDNPFNVIVSLYFEADILVFTDYGVHSYVELDGIISLAHVCCAVERE